MSNIINKKRTLIVGTAGELANDMKNFLEQRFTIKEVSFKKMLKEGISVHLIVYGGGPDVNPSLYGEQQIGSKTKIDAELDKEALHIFQSWSHTPKLGICRGAQFVTVASGGKLIQHVEGHNVPHKIDVHFEGKKSPSTLNMTSTHHQMMYPFKMDKRNYQILGWATQYNSLIYLNGKDKQIDLPDKFVEPEIVYYNRTRSLAIQGHPEFEDCDKKTQELCLNLIEDYLV